MEFSLGPAERTRATAAVTKRRAEPVRCLRQILGDQACQFAEATVPCLNVEAGGNLWQNFLESIAQSLKTKKQAV